MNALHKAVLAAVCGLTAIHTTPAQADDEKLRTQLLNTLDNLEATAKGLNLSPVMMDPISEARLRVKSASPSEFDTIPESLYSRLTIMELSTSQLRLMYDPALRPAEGPVTVAPKSSGGGYVADALDEPDYPDVEWDFEFEDEGEPDEDDTDSGSGSGICVHPGYGYETRFTTLNVAIGLEAVKDIAEQACNQDILGANTSLLCVVTDIAAYVAIGINENQELCNDFMTAAEVTASFEGLNVVHGNVQHVHDDIADVDADIATHDGDIKSGLSSHDSDIKSDIADHDADLKAALGAHDGDIKALLQMILANQGAMAEDLAEIIELLNTPQGQRPNWNN